ncbi:bifunctional 4-hydroxy-2-oxoglutarate aldolase/2-dehydro-3-deoxy-phosphogluconate aldolase [Vagococcus carniphilus]|uniref:bifunctional 4-hydroxy-2-oxoglutarate aldolase/2-dehydro-3-deoxy-phosphogluconate aldolase n=1 Tax=Vagococcus carniphilus TaxID=218144 RepID=UPI00288DC100|nr:bifunctional 4-hydroxy-2-oxoglutarate aldolase/2-dehydro-3-deoxy-phosphogluconate aldolase [Vagococcus carniphilus]MDT2849035.1 bifunctional 4-hydroxy-2-oxoglutarate aldolase/2-dehydro-3-deoxy-phosphogluconate aldolase [Vagococcus carniphilus]
MNMTEYPRFTIIMRNYSYEEAEAILIAMEDLNDQFAVEMTLNTENAIEHIKKLNEQFGSKFYIGAGTVRNIKDAKDAIDAGARFLLGPHHFTKEMFNLAKKHQVLTVPAAMTPSEVDEMIELGADIVKIFPATAVGPQFFKDIQAPLGNLPLMAVGGISSENAKEFLDNKTTYLGIGSGIFNSYDIKNKDISKLRESLNQFLASV